MKMVIHGKHLVVTPAIRSYVEEKIGRASKYFDKIMEIDVTLAAAKLKTGNSHSVDVKIYISGLTLKSSSIDTDLYAAIDEVSDIVEIQLKKAKEKRRDDAQTGHFKSFKYNAETKMVEKEAERSVVNTTLDERPMSLEEAILQLECLQRQFYTFINSETGDMNVVYLRENRDYGHIEPMKRK
ncbi:MAG: ribosome hibernation-promoting factor, HPF/YfiA family [Fusobacteriaceae bacterium]